MFGDFCGFERRKIAEVTVLSYIFSLCNLVENRGTRDRSWEPRSDSNQRWMYSAIVAVVLVNVVLAVYVMQCFAEGFPEVKETKETKETKDTKEMKETKEAKETKEVKEMKETKETKEMKEMKDKQKEDKQLENEAEAKKEK